MSVPGRKVRIAFGALPGAGEPTTWIDVSEWVMSISTTFGRSQDLDRIEASTAKVVLLNTDGRFTPQNTQSPYDPDIRPFAQIEVEWEVDTTLDPFTLGSAVLGGPGATLYDTAPSSAKMFRGLITRYRPTWLDGSGQQEFAAMEIDAVDFFRYLQTLTLSGDAFSEQTVGARIAAVLSLKGNPFPVDIDSAGVTLAAESKTGNVLEYLKEIADLDGGLFYCRGGTIVFKSRATVQGASAYLTVQAILGDQDGEYRGTGLQISLDEQFIKNRIVGKISDGTPITAQEDTESQTYYLTREEDFGTTSLVNLADLTQRAQYELEAYADARWRVDGVDFELLDPTLNSQALIGLDLMHRVTVTRRPAQGDAVSIDCLVQGFRHECTPSTWKMTILVSSAPTGWILGVSELGTGTIL